MRTSLSYLLLIAYTFLYLLLYIHIPIPVPVTYYIAIAIAAIVLQKILYIIIENIIFRAHGTRQWTLCSLIATAGSRSRSTNKGQTGHTACAWIRICAITPYYTTLILRICIYVAVVRHTLHYTARPSGHNALTARDANRHRPVVSQDIRRHSPRPRAHTQSSI